MCNRPCAGLVFWRLSAGRLAGLCCVCVRTLKWQNHMGVLSLIRPTTITEVPDDHFVVVHPLDDVPEEKVDTENLGVMPMTCSVKLSLMALRACLVLMMLLVLYHVMDLAGAFGQHAH